MYHPLVIMQQALADYYDFIAYTKKSSGDPSTHSRAVDMAETFQEKCSTFTEHQLQPMQRSFPARGGKLYAFGDIHADYCTFIVCLKLASVLNSSFTSRVGVSEARWIGGASLVVQVGDLIGGECKKCECGYGDTEEHQKSECISFMRIMKLISTLNQQAALDKGGIVTLYGNHELRHILAYNELITKTSPLRLRSQLPQGADIKLSKKKKCKRGADTCPFFEYDEDGEHDLWEQLAAPPKILKHTHRNEVRESGEHGYESHQRLFQPNGLMSQYLGCASMPVLMVGDWIFAHGGVIERFLDHPVFRHIPDDRKKLTFYNMLVRDYVLADDKGAYYFLTPGDRALHFDDLLEESGEDRTTILSPVWNNRYGVKLKKQCSKLDGPLERLRMGHMVIGHVPQYPKKISPSQLAKPNRHAAYRERGLKGKQDHTSLNFCKTDRGNMVFRTDMAMGFRNCKHRAQILEISSNGSVAYIANKVSNRQNPDKVKPYRHVML